jgi:hypothetical protein
MTIWNALARSGDGDRTGMPCTPIARIRDRRTRTRCSFAT